MRRDTALRYALLAIALLGLLLSGYLLREHYATTASSFCDINSRISCDVVNKSPYAEIFGVPVSLLGVLYYLGVLAFALAPERLAKLLAAGDTGLLWTFLAGYALFGVAFSAYLTAIEAFVINVFCPLCVVSALLVTALLAMGAWRARTA